MKYTCWSGGCGLNMPMTSVCPCSVEERPCAQPSVQILPGGRHPRVGSHKEQAGSFCGHQRAAALHVAAHPAEVPASGSLRSGFSLTSPNDIYGYALFEGAYIRVTRACHIHGVTHVMNINDTPLMFIGLHLTYTNRMTCHAMYMTGSFKLSVYIYFSEDLRWTGDLFE